MCLNNLIGAVAVTRDTDGRLSVASSIRIVVGSAWNLTSELLKSLALGLRNEERSEDTAQHEQSEDLHDMVEPRCRVGLGNMTLRPKRAEHSLGNDGANLSGSGR